VGGEEGEGVLDGPELLQDRGDEPEWEEPPTGPGGDGPDQLVQKTGETLGGDEGWVVCHPSLLVYLTRLGKRKTRRRRRKTRGDGDAVAGGRVGFGHGGVNVAERPGNVCVISEYYSHPGEGP
jgi:hypothetical protein